MARRARRCLCSFALVWFVVVSALSAGLMSTAVSPRHALAASAGCNAVNALTDGVIGSQAFVLNQSFDTGDAISFTAAEPTTGGVNSVIISIGGPPVATASYPNPGTVTYVIPSTGVLAFLAFNLGSAGPATAVLSFECIDPTPDTPTNTAVPSTDTPTNTPTNTAVPSTDTPTNTPTNTAVPSTDTPTNTPTNTSVPSTDTPTNTPTNTAVPSTDTPTNTPTNTSVPLTDTPTNTPSSTPTTVATDTPTATATLQVGQEESPTSTPESTLEVTAPPLATATTDETGGEEETPATSPTAADPTATQAVDELPDTGASPGIGGGSGLLGAVLIALALAGIGLMLRRTKVSTNR